MYQFAVTSLHFILLSPSVSQEVSSYSLHKYSVGFQSYGNVLPKTDINKHHSQRTYSLISYRSAVNNSKDDEEPPDTMQGIETSQ